MASITSNCCPRLTLSPALTSTRITFPGIGAESLNSPFSVCFSKKSGSTRLKYARPCSWTATSWFSWCRTSSWLPKPFLSPSLQLSSSKLPIWETETDICSVAFKIWKEFSFAAIRISVTSPLWFLKWTRYGSCPPARQLFFLFQGDEGSNEFSAFFSACAKSTRKQ